MSSRPRYEIVELPDRWLIAERDGVRVFVGYVAKAEPDGKGNLRITAHGPEGIVDRLPLPFTPPMVELAREPSAFSFWWKQLDFVFELTDPRTFPPLPSALSVRDREIVDWYVATAGQGSWLWQLNCQAYPDLWALRPM